jgi:hypothetical protein
LRSLANIAAPDAKRFGHHWFARAAGVFEKDQRNRSFTRFNHM